MPFYYFDAIIQERLVEDEIGIELPNIDAAIYECAAALPDVSNETLAKGQDGSAVIVIRDDHGRSLYKATLTVSFKHLPGSPDYVAEYEPQAAAVRWLQ